MTQPKPVSWETVQQVLCDIRYWTRSDAELQTSVLQKVARTAVDSGDRLLGATESICKLQLQSLGAFLQLVGVGAGLLLAVNSNCLGSTHSLRS